MNIKLSLEQSEYEPIARTAKAFGCSIEDLMYVALDEYMTRLGNFNQHSDPNSQLIHTDFDAMREVVMNTKDARKHNLPMWADSAASVHIYEGKAAEEPMKSKGSKF